MKDSAAEPSWVADSRRSKWRVFQSLIPAPESNDGWLESVVAPLLGRRSSPAAVEEYVPNCDIDESEGYYFLSLDLPGVSREDVNISVQNNTVVVSGRRPERVLREDLLHLCHEHECSSGRFQRVFSLPGAVQGEKIEADYQNGVLHIAIPKSEHSSFRPVRITTGNGSGIYDSFLPLKGKIADRKAAAGVAGARMA